jgi:hypothetical protein
MTTVKYEPIYTRIKDDGTVEIEAVAIEGEMQNVIIEPDANGGRTEEMRFVSSGELGKIKRDYNEAMSQKMMRNEMARHCKNDYATGDKTMMASMEVSTTKEEDMAEWETEKAAEAKKKEDMMKEIKDREGQL